MERHAIVVVDINGTIHLWSRGAERLLGYAVSEAVGKSLDLIIPEAMRQRHWAGFQKAMDGEYASSDRPSARLPVVRKDGTVVALAAEFVFLRDAQGRGLGAVGIFTPQG